MADNQDEPTYIVLDETTVYWATYNSSSGAAIMTMPTGGGSPVVFAKGLGPSSLSGLAVGGGYVYWSSVVDVMPPGATIVLYASIHRMSTSGGAIQFVWTDRVNGAVAGPVVSPTSLYWTDNAGGNVWTSTLDGAAWRLFAGSEAGPSALCLDSNNLYWATDVGIRTKPFGGPLAKSLAPFPLTPVPLHALAVDAVAVYSNRWTVGCVPWQTPLSGAASSPLILPIAYCGTPMMSSGGIASDGSRVYWTVPSLVGARAGGAILMFNTIGGSQFGHAPQQTWATPIADGQDDPWAVALDSRFVYWTNRGGLLGGPGRVLMAPKPN